MRLATSLDIFRQLIFGQSTSVRKLILSENKFIYSKCDSCNAIYIGKTEQNFRCRISQHLGVSFRTGATLSTPVQSDIREHCLKHKQHISRDNFSIIDRTFQKSELLSLESLHQKTKKPSIGKMAQSTP